MTSKAGRSIGDRIIEGTPELWATKPKVAERRLANIILNYWRWRGHSINIGIYRVGAATDDLWRIESDMVNGWPRELARV